MYDILELKKKKLQNLQEIAEKLKISEIKNLKKLDLINQILDKQATTPNKAADKTIQKERKINKKSMSNKEINPNNDPKE